MNRMYAFALGVWDFVVGDDWQVAVGVVLALGLTALIAALTGSAWWTMPAAVLALLAISIWRAARAVWLTAPSDPLTKDPCGEQPAAITRATQRS